MIKLDKQSKRELKHYKIIQKEVEQINREAQAMNRLYQHRNNPDSQQDNDYIDKKGKKWWQRFDQRNFPFISFHECLKLRDTTTSDRILQQSSKQPSNLSSFAKEQIAPLYDLFGQEDLLHVLFKTQDPKYRCLASYYSDSLNEQKQLECEQKERCSFKVTPSSKVELKESDDGLGQIKLLMAGYNEDEQVCRTVQRYRRSFLKHSSKNEVQMELHFWEKELQKVNKENVLAWEKLAKAVKKSNGAPVPYSTHQIQTIRDHLMWVTILKYFQHGFTDKTQQQLQQLINSQRQLKPAKSKELSTKKFFETDCKICFCSFNYDSNQVLYCDSCNTSFHLACYGLHEIPNDQTYFCDYCKAQKKDNIKKMVCQLCNKTKFPIKELNGHYYHVTCLMLFNLVSIQKSSLTLRSGLTHLKILQMVVESELKEEPCQFCTHTAGAEQGIRMRCSFAGCRKSAHPICAYINGCFFRAKRDASHQKLQIFYHCNSHNPSRDSIKQTYLRRYMCNFKKTSQLKQEIFRQKYQEQTNKMEQGRKQCKSTWDPNRIMTKTKFLKRKMVQEQQKQSTSHDTTATQSRKMLQKYQKKKK